MAVRSTAYDGSQRLLYERRCEVCDETFLAPRYRAHRFCSKSCSSRSQWRRERFCCAWCGTGFERAKSKRGKSKSGLAFCSRKCKDTAQRRGGLEAIRPGHYRNGRWAYRERALEAYGARCQCCGYAKRKKMLDVHHLDGDRNNNDVKNLQILCVWCHAFKTRGVEPHAHDGAVV